MYDVQPDDPYSQIFECISHIGRVGSFTRSRRKVLIYAAASVRVRFAVERRCLHLLLLLRRRRRRRGRRGSRGYRARPFPALAGLGAVGLEVAQQPRTLLSGARQGAHLGPPQRLTLPVPCRRVIVVGLLGTARSRARAQEGGGIKRRAGGNGKRGCVSRCEVSPLCIDPLPSPTTSAPIFSPPLPLPSSP